MVDYTSREKLTISLKKRFV